MAVGGGSARADRTAAAAAVVDWATQARRHSLPPPCLLTLASAVMEAVAVMAEGAAEAPVAAARVAEAEVPAAVADVVAVDAAAVNLLLCLLPNS